MKVTQIKKKNSLKLPLNFLKTTLSFQNFHLECLKIFWRFYPNTVVTYSNFFRNIGTNIFQDFPNFYSIAKVYFAFVGTWTVVPRRSQTYHKWGTAYEKSRTRWIWRTVWWAVFSDPAPDRRFFRRKLYDMLTYMQPRSSIWFIIHSVTCSALQPCWWVAVEINKFWSQICGKINAKSVILANFFHNFSKIFAKFFCNFLANFQKIFENVLKLYFSEFFQSFFEVSQNFLKRQNWFKTI